MQRLIILGILKESPRHGYEIKKIIKEDLGVFASLENKSIYYPLKIMEREGLIKKSVAKVKGKLTRYVYSITPAGNKEFLELALKALLSEKRPFIDIDIPLYFLPHLDKRGVMSRLRLRKRFLEKVKQWLSDNLKAGEKLPIHQQLLLKHHLNLLSAEETFVEEIAGIVKSY
ncbi:MAG: PadR family transcriptional regulator [Candidatus Omnitrophica bacterium]|nr:PadR family transcriptional regulator [Candidatus Omnitrophota bacterium]MBU2043812.1 PadR family transcriptional regulator [Candidatus Omnitrophota bacterium]MBU2251750.1 PadR family transcriptional regulator [Candidatus Omnitrophota bacterium]MBU2265589.1 PadR family transcriptional regulator [Candidatus Omnitrophota bacterium]MBU2473150.1 PadR family transcriptional regulator [Candidatus Omnitrophota bacterium]